MDFARSKPVRAECDGVPVYGYGYTYIYGVSPDFTGRRQLQRGNDAPLRKVQPQKSWQIDSNKIGVSPPRLPRTDLMDVQPQLSIRLLDGDPDTFWCSRHQNRPDVQPEWIRIDLAKEALLSQVVLVPRAGRPALPGHLTIQVSRDAWHWDTVFAGRSDEVADAATRRGGPEVHFQPLYEGETAAAGEPLEIAFEPVRAKQIWITGRNLPVVYYGKHAFALSGVQAIDAEGTNAARVSRGAGVTVSSTHYGIPSQKELHDMLWPTFYDLGVKWARVAYWGSVLNWHFVEQEKGQYVIDPRADETISECAANGVNVVLGLGHTNWLYTPQGSVDPTVAKQVWLTQEPWYGSSPGARGQLPPTSVPGMLEGFENYARFMVRHFRDRVRYFEVWNEENVCWNDESDCLCPKYFSGPAQYCQWLRRAAAIIRAEAPEARIVMGGMSPGIYCATDIEFLQGCMEEGAAELVDVIAWHAPLLVPTLDRSDYAQTKIYEKQVAEVKELAESHGFRGEYHANEWGVSAPYPQLEGAGGTVGSELAKAKYLARLVLLHHQLDITTCWCEPWNEQEVWDIGLFRNTFSADPISPQQPQAAYYVMRTLCTVLENTAPASGICVHVGEPSRRFASVQLAAGNGDLLVAVWVHEKASEEFAAVPCDVTISGTPLSRAVGIDLLNGTEQVLQAERRDRCLVVPGLLLEDYPYLIRLGKSSG